MPVTRPTLFRLAALGLSAGLAAVGLLGVEAWLRHDGRYANYYERNGLRDYGHRVEHLAEPYLHVYPPQQQITIPKAEFTIRLSTNADGLVGPAVPLEKAPEEFRIVTLGDSFTEGVGADAADSYPRRLGQLLDARSDGTPYTVVNAGISGSDPVYELELLRRRVLKYRPDMVIFTLNESDIADLQRLGGLDRYGADGQPRGRALPWWSWFFDRSHVVRAIALGVTHHDWDLRTPAEARTAAEEAIQGIVDALAVAHRLAANQRFALLAVVQPSWWEVEAGTVRPELLEVTRRLRGRGIDVADLMPYFVSHMPRPIPADYYWSKDAHYTAKGYQVLAGAVFAEVERRLPPATPR